MFTRSRGVGPKSGSHKDIVVSRKRCQCDDYPACLKDPKRDPNNHVGRTNKAADTIRRTLRSKVIDPDVEHSTNYGPNGYR